MLDDFLDRIIARLMAAAGLIIAAAIAAVAAAMSLFAFLAPVTGPAWAYAILTLTAGGVVCAWALIQRHHKAKNRPIALDVRLAEMLDKHPSWALAAGLAAGALARGQAQEALTFWRKHPKR